MCVTDSVHQLRTNKRVILTEPSFYTIIFWWALIMQIPNQYDEKRSTFSICCECYKTDVVIVKDLIVVAVICSCHLEKQIHEVQIWSTAACDILDTYFVGPHRTSVRRYCHDSVFLEHANLYKPDILNVMP